MSVNIRLVGENHYVSLNNLNRNNVSESARNFSDEYLARFGDDIIESCVATENGQLVGFFRYELWSSLLEGQYIIACGTWTHPKYRRTGLALSIWKKVLRKYDDCKISVTTVSTGGSALVTSASRQFPGRVKHI